jgi:uncharacterized small protein (DUF1192 family)
MEIQRIRQLIDEKRRLIFDEESSKNADEREHNFARLSLDALEKRREEHQDRIEVLQAEIADLEATLARLEAGMPPARAVFISYARPDQAVAEQVEAHLLSSGFQIFRDARDIRGGDWDMTIENALRDCDRMVLLLSSASMPYRKEVNREWFYFDQNRKPIHPLYLADCDLHSRMYAYNFRDARPGLQAALDLLTADLRQPFKLATTARRATRSKPTACA